MVERRVVEGSDLRSTVYECWRMLGHSFVEVVRGVTRVVERDEPVMAVEIGAVDHADTVCGWEADLSVMETAHDAKTEAAGLAAPGTDAAALAVVDSPVCEGQVAVVAHGRAAHKD